MVSDWLAGLERRLAEGGEDDLAIALVSLALAGGHRIELSEAERHAAGRRALLLLAAGGDPARGLDLEGRAVLALAADLETPERLALLAAGLAELAEAAAGLPHVSEALRALSGEQETAWRAYAAAILAEELDAEIGEE